MDKRSLLINRLEQIGESVKNSKNALALLALGSCGVEQERMDEYSDLDFFIIVKKGQKQNYIDNLDWLEAIAKVSYRFKNTPDGYKLMYEDGVFCEFAVFEPEELKYVSPAEGKFIWKDESFCQEDYLVYYEEKADQVPPETEWLIGEALTNLYIGLVRYKRGEKLSAFRFVQCYAFDRILDLAPRIEKEQGGKKDLFDKSRRFEARFPVHAKELSGLIQGYDKTPESAKAILDYLDNNFEINACMKKQIMSLF